MRTIIDLPQHQIDALAALSAERGESRAALIREAVGAYVEKNEQKHKDFDRFFGILKGEFGDGLEYQRKIRDEWE